MPPEASGAGWMEAWHHDSANGSTQRGSSLAGAVSPRAARMGGHLVRRVRFHRHLFAREPGAAGIPRLNDGHAAVGLGHHLVGRGGENGAGFDYFAGLALGEQSREHRLPAPSSVPTTRRRRNARCRAGRTARAAGPAAALPFVETVYGNRAAPTAEGRSKGRDQVPAQHREGAALFCGTRDGDDLAGRGIAAVAQIERPADEVHELVQLAPREPVREATTHQAQLSVPRIGGAIVFW